LFAGDQGIIAKTNELYREYKLNVISQGRYFKIFASNIKGNGHMGSEIINDNRAVEQITEIK